MYIRSVGFQQELVCQQFFKTKLRYFEEFYFKAQENVTIKINIKRCEKENVKLWGGGNGPFAVLMSKYVKEKR